MTDFLTQKHLATWISRIGVENQLLLARSLDLGLIEEAKYLQQADRELAWLLLQCKQLGHSTRYIWHTQDDRKVRPAHARNDERIFQWDNPPPTGHPGEDFNCRCWAEPLGDDHYARQLLITKVRDNRERWTIFTFARHYRNGKGKEISLEKTGYMNDVIDHFANHALASDGKPGVYRAVEEQIINRAKEQGEGSLDYDFKRSFNFGPVNSVFANSIVEGVFDGDARKEEGGYLVINGVMTYSFSDEYTDPLQIIEITERIPGINREEALTIVQDLGINIDFAGTVFFTKGTWKTKFNATVKID